MDAVRKGQQWHGGEGGARGKGERGGGNSAERALILAYHILRCYHGNEGTN